MHLTPQGFGQGFATSGVFQATNTSGAPGADTYLWSLVSGSGTFLNPLTATTQRINVVGPTDGVTRHVTAHCVVTDSQGNTSTTPNIDFSYSS